MVNDAQTPNAAPQSMSEWVAEHCRFNIGELDNLEWEVSGAEFVGEHCAWTSEATYYSKGELVVRCTNESMSKCLSKCPMQVDTISHYLNAVPN